MNYKIIVVDDFYEDPEMIRELALGQQCVRKEGATYPGAEAIVAEYDWHPVWLRLRSLIPEVCDAECPKSPPFPQGKFRLALESDNCSRLDKVHIDVQRWSGIVYLSRDEDCKEGLLLYRNRITSCDEWDEDWFRTHYGHLYLLPPNEFRKQVLAFFNDERIFELSGMVPMKFNRAVLLMAHCYHGSGCGFGTSTREGRLTQHFEFYSNLDHH